MSNIKVKSIKNLWAEFEVPGDKSISHRAAIIAGLSNGTCRIDNFLPSEDCVCTLNAMAQLGATHEVLESLEGFGPTSLNIHGCMCMFVLVCIVCVCVCMCVYEYLYVCACV